MTSLGQPVRRHRPLLAVRLVPLPELRLPGGRGGRHGQDDAPTRPSARCAPTPASPPAQPFTYEAWKEAVRRGETFVTYGPLLEFAVDGQPMGSRIAMTASGGTVDVTWEVASVTVPMSRVELVVNGEIRESVAVAPGAGERALVGQGRPELAGWRCWCAGTTPTSPRSSPPTPRR